MGISTEVNSDSSLLFTREDGKKAFVHDTFQDYFLAKWFAYQINHEKMSQKQVWVNHLSYSENQDLWGFSNMSSDECRLVLLKMESVSNFIAALLDESKLPEYVSLFIPPTQRIFSHDSFHSDFSRYAVGFNPFFKNLHIASRFEVASFFKEKVLDEMITSISFFDTVPFPPTSYDGYSPIDVNTYHDKIIREKKQMYDSISVVADDKSIDYLMGRFISLSGGVREFTDESLLHQFTRMGFNQTVLASSEQVIILDALNQCLKNNPALKSRKELSDGLETKNIYKMTSTFLSVPKEGLSSTSQYSRDGSNIGDLLRKDAYYFNRVIMSSFTVMRNDNVVSDFTYYLLSGPYDSCWENTVRATANIGSDEVLRLLCHVGREIIVSNVAKYAVVGESIAQCRKVIQQTEETYGGEIHHPTYM